MTLQMSLRESAMFKKYKKIQLNGLAATRIPKFKEKFIN